jgi:hypothetical protein
METDEGAFDPLAALAHQAAASVGRESAGDCHSPALEPSATETTHAFISLSSPGISHRFCGGDQKAILGV